MTIDLLATLHIVDDDVAAVFDANMADPQRGMVSFGEGYQIDPALALAAHPFASQLIGQPWAGEELRHAAVRAAIMFARPQLAKATYEPHRSGWTASRRRRSLHVTDVEITGSNSP